VSEGDWQVDVHAVGIPFPTPIDGETMVFNCGLRIGRLGPGGIRESVAPGLLAMVEQIRRNVKEV
jgi:hypothetical protein